jgi:hypothetical protein
MMMVAAQEAGLVDIMSASFLKDGFCVSNKDQSIYVQSHMLCFYGDTAFAILLYVLCKLGEGNINQDALDFVKINILGIFGHGCGHFALGI